MNSQQNKKLIFSKRGQIPGWILCFWRFCRQFHSTWGWTMFPNTLQATIHPFVCYNKLPDVGCNVETVSNHISLVILSESNNHDSHEAVHLFQRLLIQFLKENVMQPKHIVHFSDGCTVRWTGLVLLWNHVKAA